MSHAETAASCTGVTRVHRSETGEVPALRGIDLTIAAGVVTGVVGPSGAGKSTLLRLLAAIDRPTSGEVVVAGTATQDASDRALRLLRRRHVGIVGQRPAGNLLPGLDAVDHVRRAGLLRGVEVDAAAQLGLVGLGDRLGHRPHELSGGEQQRLAVAAALVGPPTIVLADEPTGELDVDASDRVVHLLAVAASLGAAVVVSTHEETVQARCDRVLHLHHGAFHGETARGGRLLVSIDAAGRLQLPPAAWEWFPEGRAVVELGDREVSVRPPTEEGT